MMRTLLPLLLAVACSDKGSDDTGGVDQVPAEICNGIDDDGDGDIDEGVVPSWYADDDGDGYGDEYRYLDQCDAPPGTVAVAGDCDDYDADIHPGAVERCNDADDDCDGEIDEEAEDVSGWYPDDDGDGYGDATADPEISCGDENQVADASDCNDGDAEVHPNATERCNGVDDDCDASTGEAGTALFLHSDGSQSDWTETLGEGAEWATVTAVVSSPGVLQLCEGTWYASLRVRADLSLVGFEDGVVLDGVGETGLVIIRTAGVDVSVSDLTIRNGAGSGAVLGEYSAGGGLECDADAKLSLSQVDVQSNVAGVGGGMYVRGCEVTVDGGSFSGNEADYYGGGVAVVGGTVDLSETTITDNLAAFGGGVAVVGFDGEAAVTLDDSPVDGNAADIQGGGMLVEDAVIDCVSGATTGVGVTSNLAGEGGGAYVGLGGELTSERCSWGESSDDNDPDDVVTTTGGDAGDYGDTETFTCDEDGCTP